jgi:hypothetical protein
MQRYFYTNFLRTLATLAALASTALWAQPNVLGLPAVPQNMASPSSAPAATTHNTPTTSKPAASASAQHAVVDQQAKSVLSGGVSMVSSYVGQRANVRVTTNATYPSPAQREAAFQAARLVQRDVALACGKQCKAAPMPEPKLLADQKLQFDMVIDHYPRVLSSDDMVAMLLGKPLAAPPKAPPKAPAGLSTKATSPPTGTPIAVPLRPITVPTEPAPPATPVASASAAR